MGDIELITSPPPLSPATSPVKDEDEEVSPTEQTPALKDPDINTETDPDESPSLPCVIQYQNLTYKVAVPQKEKSKIATFATAVRDTLTWWKPAKIREKVILNRVSGILRPGTMTLLMGPPGSGKSALLKALAGRVPWSNLTGSVKYNQEQAQDLILENLIDFVSQTDDHFAHLTVRETFEFALQCSTSDFSSKRVDNMLRTLNLEGVQNTVVGNQTLRGISGGQKKRVTTGEMLIRGNPVLLMDEITNGLDSATAVEIIRTIRASCKRRKQTVVISLLQPPPEVFELFDDVLLLANGGNVAYHGPRDQILDYFYEIGFELPVGKDLADFLQEVVTPLGQQYLRRNFAQDVPSKPYQFGDKWKKSSKYKSLALALRKGKNFDTTVDGNLTLLFHLRKDNPQKKVWNRTYWDHQKLVTSKLWALMKRDKLYVQARLSQQIIMGFILGTLFYQINKSEFILRYGIIFYVALTLSFGTLAELETIMYQRNIFYKWRQANFFRTSNWVMADLLVHIPVALAECIVLGSFVYWLVGLAPQADRFFFFIFYCLSMHVSIGSFARFSACAFRDMGAAIPPLVMLINFMVIFAGFLITEDHLAEGWKWAFWISPLSWSIRSLIQNEYYSPIFDDLTPDGQRLGDVYLKIFGTRLDKSWQWAGFGYLCLFFIIFTIGQTLALEYIRFDGPNSASEKVQDEDEEEEELLAQEVERERLRLEAKEKSEDESGVEEEPTEEKRRKKETKVAIPIAKHNTFTFTPTSLVFEDIKYTIIKPGQKKSRCGKREMIRLELLQSVNGYAKPGRMMALMGESGAGKTTLLDVLAGRKTEGIIEGKIYVNGYETSPKKFSRVVGYVEQFDTHMPTATVYEALMFSATLRLPNATQEQRESFVQEILELLELTSLSGSLIGLPGEGISNEQRKRLTIGVELAANPSLIFLDEPTTGLDSHAAQIVMRVMRNIAATGRTIICTIHQPSGEIFKLFDDLLLLKRGGKVVYLGELGDEASNLVRYLESFPDVRKCEAGVNPATWMLQVVEDASHSDRDFSVHYEESELKRTAMGVITELKEPTTKLEFERSFAAPVKTQIHELVKRALTNYWRTPTYSFYRNLTYLALALLFGAVFFKVNPNGESGVHALISMIYMTTSFGGILVFASVLPMINVQSEVYFRERSSKAYSVTPFAVALLTAEIPYLILVTFVFLSPLYFMIGFKSTAASFFFYFLLMFVFMAMYAFFGIFCAVLFPTVRVAQTFGMGISQLFQLFSGFFVPEPDIPNYWIWLHYVSPIKYIMNALISDQFYCEGADCPIIPVLDATGQTTNQFTWDYVRNQYGFEYEQRWLDFGIILIYSSFFAIVAFLGLKFVKHVTR